jgi:putative ABC transport system permease protein
MNFAEVVRFGLAALAANRMRTLLTALGLLIGNAAVIWVVTISATSTELILGQIHGLGSNMIYAYYEGGDLTARDAQADFVKMADVEAVRRQLGDRIVAATGVITNFDRMMIDGRERDVKVIGSDEHYAAVRNLVILAGRFLDSSDIAGRTKVALLTDRLAIRLYGDHQAAIGRIIKVFTLQFTEVGVFKERAESFGQTEVARETILIPIPVIRYFTPVERIDPMYVQARSLDEVTAVSGVVREILESRHRPGAKYLVDNLGAILSTAKTITFILGVVLLLIALISLVISGIGIMNIMLVTVTERTREIGIRLAVGATRRDILLQFLAEAILISVAGGMVGVLAGLAPPVAARYLAPQIPVEVSWTAVAVAFLFSFLVGLIFGMIPAGRASRLNPTEALRYE